MIRATVLAMIPARLFHEVLALPPEERREFALRVLETVEDRDGSPTCCSTHVTTIVG